MSVSPVPGHSLSTSLSKSKLLHCGSGSPCSEQPSRPPEVSTPGAVSISSFRRLTEIREVKKPHKAQEGPKTEELQSPSYRLYKQQQEAARKRMPWPSCQVLQDIPVVQPSRVINDSDAFELSTFLSETPHWCSVSGSDKVIALPGWTLVEELLWSVIHCSSGERDMHSHLPGESRTTVGLYTWGPPPGCRHPATARSPAVHRSLRGHSHWECRNQLLILHRGHMFSKPKHFLRNPGLLQNASVPREIEVTGFLVLQGPPLH